MTRVDVVAELKRCTPGGWNALFHGARGLASLPANGSINRRLVTRVMRYVFARDVSPCRKLTAAYVPVALVELARAAKTNPDATLLVHYVGGDGARLQAAASWLREADRVNAKNRARLPALVHDTDGVAAACATVARHGLAANTLLAFLAHAGGDAAIDAVVEVFERAVSARDEALDDFAEYFVPFARGPRMTALAAEITAALAARGGQSPLLALAAKQWGAPRLTKLRLEVSIDSRQVYKGLSRKAGAWIVLDSHALPNAKAFLTWSKLNFDATVWADGRLKKDELNIGKPRDVDDLPRWLAAAAKKLKIHWDPTTLRVTSTLRGKQRAAAVAWLYPHLA